MTIPRTIDSFLKLEWQQPDGPLIEPPVLSPLIADPSFLFPEESPDGLWHLFAHSAWGIHYYSSADGLRWRQLGRILDWGMRAFVRRFGDRYFLYYEACRPFAIPLLLLPRRPAWRSRIMCRHSRDLRHWSKPELIIDNDAAWAADSSWGAAVSNPCLVADEPDASAENGAQWRLYYSASLVHVPDCGFEEPRYIALATRSLDKNPAGRFTSPAEPLLRPEQDELPGVIGAGSMKVLQLQDGWLALQNKIYRDGEGQSRSAIFVLRSADGLHWQPARDDPLVRPDAGWRASHVYACDLRWREADQSWYLYYNARDTWGKSSGRERIGRLSAKH
ncbi:MAG: glycosyl hydrolase family 43 [Spirochaetes bacterium]|nr:glycosyl hydrolase family 43 [Spirochaetota bacterium]